MAKGRGWIWAVVQIAVFGGEIFALLFLLAQPAFRPRHLEVTGTKHLTVSQVTGALSLPADRSIFLLRPQHLPPQPDRSGPASAGTALGALRHRQPGSPGPGLGQGHGVDAVGGSPGRRNDIFLERPGRSARSGRGGR